MTEETKESTKKVTFGENTVQEIWDETKNPMKEGEELVFDNSAYEMLHRAKVEWPCLSIDFLLRERINGDSSNQVSSKSQEWFPHYLHTLDPKNVKTDKKGIMRHKNDKFPYNVYLVAGSQAPKKNENKIYVMKWGDMHKTLRDDDDVANDESEDSDHDHDLEKEPDMRY